MKEVQDEEAIGRRDGAGRIYSGEVMSRELKTSSRAYKMYAWKTPSLDGEICKTEEGQNMRRSGSVFIGAIKLSGLDAGRRAGLAIAGLISMLALSACSSNPLSRVTTLWGGDRNNEAVEIQEDEKRVSVLALEEVLTPNPRFENEEVAVPPPYLNANWTQANGDPDHSMHNLTLAPLLSRQWSTTIGTKSSKRSPLTAPPVVVDGLVYVIDAKARVTAFSAETGKQIWRRDLAPDVSEKRRFYDVLGRNRPHEIGFGGGLAYDSGKIFVSSGFGFVSALESKTGEKLWQFDTDAPIRGAPTAADSKVFVSSHINEFFALDQETGERLWGYESFDEPARFLSSSSPAVNENAVIIPFSSGELIALRLENGRQLWAQTISRSSRRTALSDLNDIAGSPIIDRGIAYAIGHAAQMSAIDIKSGKELWQIGVGGLNMPWIAGDYLFILSVNNEIVCLHREDGAVVWVRELPTRFKKWLRPAKRIAWTGPVMGNGELILTSSLGDMLFLSPKTGEEIRAVKLKHGVTVPLVIADEGVFILDEAGKLNLYR